MDPGLQGRSIRLQNLYSTSEYYAAASEVFEQHPIENQMPSYLNHLYSEKECTILTII